MAADPRQFTEHNEVAGGNIYYEDKRMEELKGATGKTASQISTTNEYIPLQDTDGNLVKINPASFQEAVRNVLGSLLANNDKGTTISGVPALSGNGASLDFGSITPANLASVLGAQVHPISGGNCNDAIQGWNSCVVSVASNIPTNLGNATTFWIHHQILNSTYNVAVQNGYVTGGTKGFQHYTRKCQDGIWGDWIQEYNEGVLSDSALLSPLASALGVANNKGIIREGSCDNLTTTGKYVITSIDGPVSGTSLLLVLNFGSTRTFQLVIGQSDNDSMFYRRSNNQGTWSSWKQVSTEQ